MAEQPRKKTKLSKTPMSAFAAVAAKKTAISEQDSNPQGRLTGVISSANVRVHGANTSSTIATSSNGVSNNQHQSQKNDFGQSGRPVTPLPNEISLGLPEQDMLRLRTLLFPYPDDFPSNRHIQSAIIEGSNRPPSTPKPKTDWREKQEQAIKEIFSLCTNTPYMLSRAFTDVEKRPKIQPQRFVRATADLVCATLNDGNREYRSYWKSFFECLHEPPERINQRPANRNLSTDMTQVLQDSAADQDKIGAESADHLGEEPEEDTFSSQSYMLQATYTTSWIRFVNAFADRDVRSSKSVQLQTLQSTDDAEQLQAAEPHHVEPISPPQQEEPLLRPSESISNDIFESQPSFLSLNMYDVLSFQNPESDASPSSAPNSPKPCSDSGKAKRTRNEGTMYAQASLIEMPLNFIDMRHLCVHSDSMPPLDGEMGLRSMVRRGLRWVWDRYWADIGQPEQP